MSASDGTQTREHRSFVILVALTAVLGVIDIAWSTSHTPPFQNDTVAEVAHGLSEALFIAAFVAAVVDPYAKRRFAVEVGRSVLLALFGRNAPQRYIDGLREALRRTESHSTLCGSCAWTGTVRASYCAWIYGSTARSRTFPRLRCRRHPPGCHRRSPAGAPDTQFLEYRVRVTPAGGPAAGMITRTLAGDELRHAAATERARWITLDLDQSLERLRVPPGATQDFTLAGVAYAAVPALFPLVLSNPALRQTVQIGGPALPELNLDVFFGRKRSSARSWRSG
jgi:hypothetical protein